MIDYKENTCPNCGHYREEHLEYIDELELCGFYTWAISARKKVAKDQIKKFKQFTYCPEVEIKFTDRELRIY